MEMKTKRNEISADYKRVETEFYGVLRKILSPKLYAL